MNKNISTNKLLVACIIIAIGIIFFRIYKVEKKSNQPAKQEAIEEEPAAEFNYAIPRSGKEGLASKPGYTVPRNIFPTDDEAKANLKNQLERQQTIDKSLAEKMQIMADVRKDVELSLNEQPASTAAETNASGGSQSAAKQVTTTFADEQKKLALQKEKIAALKNKELFIHH